MKRCSVIVFVLTCERRDYISVPVNFHAHKLSFLVPLPPPSPCASHTGTLPHFGLAIVYIFLHAMLMLFQATTLNVAFNSHNKALLTIMMSNNFVELKGSVFKKFEKNNLFQVRRQPFFACPCD